jgi:putative transposase
MARLPRLALAGHTHCLLQRAAGPQPVFRDDTDRRAYIAALREALAAEEVALHAWSLRDDEVRLLATPAQPPSLARWMQALGRRFVAAHHRRHGGRGSLWDGRFRSTVVEPGAPRLAALCWVDAAAEAGEPDPLRGSAGHRLGRWRDALLTDLPEFWALGNTPFEREAAWAALLARGLPPAQAQALRGATLGGWPWGSAAFVQALAEQVARPVAPRPRGRPRRAASVPADE